MCLQPRLYCGDQFFLRHILGCQRRQNIFVYRIFCNDMMDRDGILLPLPPEPSIRLLIQFQTPRQSKPDQDVPALLDIQAVSGRGRMNQGDINLSLVPVLDNSACASGIGRPPVKAGKGQSGKPRTFRQAARSPSPHRRSPGSRRSSHCWSGPSSASGR